MHLGSRYHVNPVILGSIYVGAIPFFFASLWWLVRNLKDRKPVVLPILATGLGVVSIRGHSSRAVALRSEQQARMVAINKGYIRIDRVG